MHKQPSYEALYSRLDELLAPALSQDWPNLPAARAKGVYVYDRDGKPHLDFLAGFGACNAGHNHPRIVAAARQQMEKMVHAPVGVMASEPLLRLAHKLGEVAPGRADMFFFGNSGSEAVDGALKLARYVTGRPGFIAFTGSFHGRTMGGTAVTASKAKYRRGHGPHLPEIYFARFPYPYRSTAPDDEACAKEALRDIERLFKYVVCPEAVAAFIVEPIQGEGGYVFPPRSWLEGLRELSDGHDILLIFDEVQSGFGRTGEWFAADLYDVQPDIVCLAKGMANGFRLGALAAPGEIMGQWGAASHGTTYGGNPVACAAALATLDVIREEGLLENAREQGSYTLDELHNLQDQSPIVGDVRGAGLMIAVEFIEPGTGKEPNTRAVRRVLDRCLEDGLLMYPCGHWTQTIRLIPPLTITREQVDQGLDIFRRAVLAEG
ncbi:MAG: aspartate aminotransferase family protein [Anaerolineae bacterium]|jgi:4-aminobutyrate aminotransferase